MPPGVSVISHRKPLHNCHVTSVLVTSQVGMSNLDGWLLDQSTSLPSGLYGQVN